MRKKWSLLIKLILVIEKIYDCCEFIREVSARVVVFWEIVAVDNISSVGENRGEKIGGIVSKDVV